MSNTADIMAIDGPLAAVMFNHPLPVPDTFTAPSANGFVTYQHVEHHNADDGMNYHIAIIDTETPAEYINSFIAMHNFTPSWDINPRTANPPVE